MVIMMVGVVMKMTTMMMTIIIHIYNCQTLVQLSVPLFLPNGAPYGKMERQPKGNC
jgi:hypothetical protein